MKKLRIKQDKNPCLSILWFNVLPLQPPIHVGITEGFRFFLPLFKKKKRKWEAMAARVEIVVSFFPLYLSLLWHSMKVFKQKFENWKKCQIENFAAAGWGKIMGRRIETEGCKDTIFFQEMLSSRWVVGCAPLPSLSLSLSNTPTHSHARTHTHSPKHTFSIYLSTLAML